MLLFKREHVGLIRKKRKTQTRRLGEKRWNVGSLHLCYTRPPMTGERPFARVRILAVREERLGDISEADARAEGYSTIDQYIGAFCRINRIPNPASHVLNARVWAVTFELKEVFPWGS
jgi:hypothetical protein